MLHTCWFLSWQQSIVMPPLSGLVYRTVWMQCKLHLHGFSCQSRVWILFHFQGQVFTCRSVHEKPGYSHVTHVRTQEFKWCILFAQKLIKVILESEQTQHNLVYCVLSYKILALADKVYPPDFQQQEVKASANIKHALTFGLSGCLPCMGGGGADSWGWRDGIIMGSLRTNHWII